MLELRRLLFFVTEPKWYVELKGKRIATLSDPAFVDMFWYNWAVKLHTDNTREINCIWEFTEPDIVYRDRATRQISLGFPAGAYLEIRYEFFRTI